MEAETARFAKRPTWGVNPEPTESGRYARSERDALFRFQQGQSHPKLRLWRDGGTSKAMYQRERRGSGLWGDGVIVS